MKEKILEIVKKAKTEEDAYTRCLKLRLASGSTVASKLKKRAQLAEKIEEIETELGEIGEAFTELNDDIVHDDGDDLWGFSGVIYCLDERLAREMGYSRWDEYVGWINSNC